MKRLALLLAFVLALAACASERRADKAPLPVTARVVAAVQSGQDRLATGARYSAVLAPREQVALAFNVPGYVDELLTLPGPDGRPVTLDKGNTVAKGQVLARLRDGDYKAKVAQARFALEEARASATQARKDQERNATLLRGQVIALGEFDKVQEKLDVAKARVEQAASALEQAEINLRDASLTAPMAGVILRRDIERGSLVASGTQAFILADLTSVKAVFGLPDQELAHIALGDTLSVSVDALSGREALGTVTAISPSADPKSRAFDVELTIANQDRMLKDGMIATVRPAPEASNASLAAVPLQAVVRTKNGAGYLVHVISEANGKTTASARPITVEGMAGNMVAVSAGLTPGERVITRGATLVADGQAVNVMP